MGDSLDYSSMESSISNLKTYAEAVRTNLQAVNNIVDNDVCSGAGIWEGQAAQNFVNKWQEVSSQIPTLCTYMENQVDNLKGALKNFATADDAQVS